MIVICFDFCRHQMYVSYLAPLNQVYRSSGCWSNNIPSVDERRFFYLWVFKCMGFLGRVFWVNFFWGSRFWVPILEGVLNPHFDRFLLGLDFDIDFVDLPILGQDFWVPILIDFWVSIFPVITICISILIKSKWDPKRLPKWGSKIDPKIGGPENPHPK